MSKRIGTLISDGNWYKGNLHCHTTCSDGNCSPSDTVEVYRKNGYQFLGLSDHNIFNCSAGIEAEDILLLPSVERNIDVSGEHKCFHIVGTGFDLDNGKTRYENGTVFQVPAWEGYESVQNVIDDLAAHDNLAILAHPVWSRNELDDLLSLHGYTGIEIYNNVCEVEWHLGYAELYWDLLLKRGIRVWGFATDDTHNVAKHSCGGWIAVKAEALTFAAIRDSIVSGSFYSSTGPEIYDFYVEGDQAVVRCSPAQAIHFVTYDNLGRSYYPQDGALTEGKHILGGVEKFVRVEIVDDKGKKAWSNPVFLEW